MGWACGKMLDCWVVGDWSCVKAKTRRYKVEDSDNQTIRWDISYMYVFELLLIASFKSYFFTTAS